MPKTIDQNTLIGDTHHAWTFQEYQQYERGQVWHIAMITIGVVLALYGVLSGNFLFALIVILVGIILFLQSQHSPPEVLFQIADLGVVVGNRFYPYAELDQFYIIYDPPQAKNLFFETKSSFRPMLRIPLADVNPVHVRQTLRTYLQEDIEREEEPLSEVLGRQWKIH